MKKRILTVAMFIMFLNISKAQNDTEHDSTVYKPRKLTIEQVNLATSYYSQKGDNSAVTGGIGSEKLEDYATTLNLDISKYDRHNNKHLLNLECGIDVYTSASSDKIDPSSVSSASSGDMRIYPSLNYLFSNTDKRYTLGGGMSFSSEFDYTSAGVNVLFSKSSKDNNRMLSAKASAFFDTWKVILPVELRGIETEPQNTNRNSYNLGLVFSQVINKEFQLALLADISYQKGLLGTKFNRVYFTNGTEKSENLPDNRFKLPIGIRASYFLGDNIVLRGLYRYYFDTWHLNAHTASLEVTYKVSPFVSLSPSYRFYTQTAAKNFAPFKQNDVSQQYYTSDYDLSKLNSNMVGLNARFTALNGKLGLKALNTLELRYGYYNRSTGLNSHILTLVLTFKKM